MLDYYHGTQFVMKNIINGWQVSPIITLRKGAPFTVTSGTDINLHGFNSACPNVTESHSQPEPLSR